MPGSTVRAPLEPDALLSPDGDACRVNAEDLNSLATVHDLLSALNDPWAGRSRIVTLVAGVPVLGNRCIRRALRKRPGSRVLSLDQALSLLGNGGLEAELLELLEDLTVLKADLQPGGDRRG